MTMIYNVHFTAFEVKHSAECREVKHSAECREVKYGTNNEIFELLRLYFRSRVRQIETAIPGWGAKFTCQLFIEHCLDACQENYSNWTSNSNNIQKFHATIVIFAMMYISNNLAKEITEYDLFKKHLNHRQYMQKKYPENHKRIKMEIIMAKKKELRELTKPN